MTIDDIIGNYQIKGHNQDAAQSMYVGELALSFDRNRRIIALWSISGSQVQKGTGFFKDGILVINFNYKNDTNQVFKGVVVYKCLSKNILDGFWSEKHGDPLFLGMEQAFRVTENKDLVH